MSTRRFNLSVFCGYGPGLKLENLGLGLIAPGSIKAIDFHVDIDPNVASGELEALPAILEEHGLLLDAIVFGLPDEKWDSPEIARANVGFAAPGTPRRLERFAYAKALAEKVAATLKPEHFTRGQLTLKGHFGAFNAAQENRYHNLCMGLQQLRAEALMPNNILMLAETGCEDAAAVIELINSVGADSYGANWDTANLALWGENIDNIEYGAALAEAGVLKGVHIKGGVAADTAGAWGHEIEPDEALISSVLGVLDTASCFNGPITVEREMFLGDQRESQAEKAAGLNNTLALVASQMPEE